MNKLNDKSAAVKMYTDAAKAIADFDLQARLDRAMRKAGTNVAVTLSPGILNMAYDDAEAIEVLCDDAAAQNRAAIWVQKALAMAGVRLTRTGGSWGRAPQVIGSAFAHNTGDRVLVVISMSSIGE